MAVVHVDRCAAQVWVTAELDSRGRVRLGVDSDSELTRGLAAVLVRCLSGLTPEELLQVAASWGLLAPLAKHRALSLRYLFKVCVEAA